MKMGKKNRKSRHSRAYSALIYSVFNWKIYLDSLVYIQEYKNSSEREYNRKYKSKTYYDRYYDRYHNEVNSNITLIKEKYKEPQSKILPWDDLTQIQKQAFFFYNMARYYQDIITFTLDFSSDFTKKCKNKTYQEIKTIIIKRIRSQFEYHKNSLEYTPMYLFSIEGRKKNLHIHGIIEVRYGKKDLLKQILKVVGFGAKYKDSKMDEKRMVKFYEYGSEGPKGWCRYMIKNVSASYSLYICNSLRHEIKLKYDRIFETYRNYKKGVMPSNYVGDYFSNKKPRTVLSYQVGSN